MVGFSDENATMLLSSAAVPNDEASPGLKARGKPFLDGKLLKML